MEAVVFAFGNKPGLSGLQAIEIAQLLEGKGTLIALEVASKIRGQAIRDPERGEISEDVELNPHEMATLLAFLEEPSPTPDSHAIQNLRLELAQVLAR